MTKTTNINRLSHAVYVVEGEGPNAFWTRIGAAWMHEDGEGFNVQLTAMPLNGFATSWELWRGRLLSGHGPVIAKGPWGTPGPLHP